MTDIDYWSSTPPENKPPDEYTWAERRAEIADMIERAGHYRNLERSQRDLGRRYGVTHRQIQKDIRKVNAQKAEQLGDNSESELATLQTRAVQDLLDEGDSEGAYYLMRKHYETLMDAAAADQEKVADKQEHEHSGKDGGPIQVDITETVVETPHSESDE